MASVFDKKTNEVEPLKREHEAEKEALVNKIGQLTIDVDWLKKKTTTSLGTEEKKDLIDFKHEKLTVRHQCELLDLSRSTAYYNSADPEPSDNEITIKNA